MATKKSTKLKKLRVGVPRAFLAKGVDPDVLELFEASLAKLTEAGHTVVDIECN